jgi:ABC-type proline/glycine betaine transport system permease subunit
MLAMAEYWLSGLWTASVTHFYLASLPGVIIATPLGVVWTEHRKRCHRAATQICSKRFRE